ncbi:hypothetical protein SISNIDRAFT_456445 [Sistotremastrum niveocremeum HHB9708]|uniref:Uncharacterized protein n=1 Tax=Sistotremastrum niveocremeum HHB9708 TaxID=1314777 RepID=A0A164SVT2_9AGAM|nr:hypothetical protein SISNIDRAFT_456445 [Sistotremastrum niveocremeum HHB9708]
MAEILRSSTPTMTTSMPSSSLHLQPSSSDTLHVNTHIERSPKARRRKAEKISPQEQYARLQAKYGDPEGSSGMPGDRSRTIEDQRELFGLLDSAGVPWSLNGVGAMRFWGVPKVVTSVDLIVPTPLLERATHALVASNLFQLTRPSRAAGREAFVSFPRLKRTGVNMFVVLVPTSFCDLILPDDCVSDADPQSGITLHAPKPSRLIHAFLYAKNHNNLEAGHVHVEYLLLFNSEEPEWGDDIVNEIEDEEEKRQLLQVIKVRAHDRLMPGGVMHGKWKDMSKADRHRLRFSPL